MDQEIANLKKIFFSNLCFDGCKKLKFIFRGVYTPYYNMSKFEKYIKNLRVLKITFNILMEPAGFKPKIFEFGHQK